MILASPPYVESVNSRCEDELLGRELPSPDRTGVARSGAMTGPLAVLEMVKRLAAGEVGPAPAFTLEDAVGALAPASP